VIRDREFETMPRVELEGLQLRRLQALVKRVYGTAAYYRRKMDDAGVAPDDIKSLDDLNRLPFTTKDDLRENYPFGLFTVPMDEVVRVHASSGTTGKPTVVGYTKNDIKLWAALMARTLTAAGATPKDIIQNAYGYGLFTGGLGAHYGAEELGATVIPVSGGQTKRQVTIMLDLQTTVLLSTPSYALNIAEVMAEMGVDPLLLPLRVGLFGAEPWSANMRLELEKKLSIKAVDIYGLSEVIGPGVASECIEAQAGLHIFEDHFLPEIVDRKTLASVTDGEEGELVFTTLTKEAFPVIRYRTGDIATLDRSPCECGRTFRRIRKITGRTDDMLIIRGVNVFPSQIEHVLMNIEGVEPHYQIIVDRCGAMDTMEVRVEVSDRGLCGETDYMDNLAAQIQREIKNLIGSTCKVSLVDCKTLRRSEGKARRVIDKRKL